MPCCRDLETLVVLDRVISWLTLADCCVLFVVAVAVDHAKIDMSPHEHCYLTTTAHHVMIR